MLRHIMAILPPHRTYVEPFAGGATIFWNKRPSEVEVLNDLNGEVANFYQMLKSNPERLSRMIDATPHSRSAYEAARAVYKHPDFFGPLRRAWAFWILCEQSFASKTAHGWGCGIETSAASEYESQKSKFVARASAYAERLSNTQIEKIDALRCILKYDTPNTFFYIDPPYVGTNCGDYSHYRASNYEALIQLISKMRGLFLLSSFENEAALEAAEKHGWKVKKVERSLSAGTGRSVKRKRSTEILVFNYDEPALFS